MTITIKITIDNPTEIRRHADKANQGVAHYVLENITDGLGDSLTTAQVSVQDRRGSKWEREEATL